MHFKNPCSYLFIYFIRFYFSQVNTEILEDSSESNFVETLKKIIKDTKDSKSFPNKKTPKLPTSAADDGKVRVRVTRIKFDKENKNTLKLDEEEELEVFDSNHRKIEESVQQHLENAGVNVGGGKYTFIKISFENYLPIGEDENYIIYSTSQVILNCFTPMSHSQGLFDLQPNKYLDPVFILLTIPQQIFHACFALFILKSIMQHVLAKELK